MLADRPHDVSSLTAIQLERARRDLEISLALAFPSFPRARVDPGPDDRHRRGAGRARRRPVIRHPPGRDACQRTLTKRSLVELLPIT